MNMGEYGNEGVGADLYLDVVKNSRSRGVDEARGFRTCCYLVEKAVLRHRPVTSPPCVLVVKYFLRQMTPIRRGPLRLR